MQQYQCLNANLTAISLSRSLFFFVLMCFYICILAPAIMRKFPQPWAFLMDEKKLHNIKKKGTGMDSNHTPNNKTNEFTGFPLKRTSTNFMWRLLIIVIITIIISRYNYCFSHFLFFCFLLFVCFSYVSVQFL